MLQDGVYILCVCAFVGLAGFFQRCISKSDLQSCRNFDLRRSCPLPPCRVLPPRLAPSWAATVARGRTRQVSLVLFIKPVVLLNCFCVCVWSLSTSFTTSQIWILPLTIKFPQRERVGGAPAAAPSPTHLKVPPSVRETSSPLTGQVINSENQDKPGSDVF